MKALLKKYWLKLLLMVILAASVLYNYNQKNHYLSTDDEQLRKAVLRIVIVLLVALFLLLLAAFMKGRIKLKALPAALFGGIVVIDSCYFFLHPIFLSGAYLLNRSFIRGTVSRLYVVRYVDRETNRFLLYDAKNGKPIWDENIRLNQTASLLKKKDTVTFLYEKGLLGFLFDPATKQR